MKMETGIILQKQMKPAIYYAVTGTNETIGGKLYHFNLDGTMASQGWGLHEDGSWYYAYASGELATGDVTIGGTAYHFDENGKMKSGVVVVEMESASCTARMAHC